MPKVLPAGEQGAKVKRQITLCALSLLIPFVTHLLLTQFPRLSVCVVQQFISPSIIDNSFFLWVPLDSRFRSQSDVSQVGKRC